MKGIIKIDPLLRFADAIRAVDDEARVHLEKNGLRVSAIDPAKVVSVNTMLGAAAFEHYESERGIVGLDLKRLDDLAALASSDDVVELEIDDGGLHVTIGTLEATIATIDPESIRQEPGAVDLELPTSVALEGRDLARIVKAADLVSDHVRFEGIDDVLISRARGDTDDVRLEFGPDEYLEGTDLVGDPVGLYSLDYLKDLARPIDADDEITLEIGVDFPLRLRYGFADGIGTVTYLCAPRLET